MKRFLGFILCLPMLALIAGAIYWIVSCVTLQEIVIKLICWILGVIIALVACLLIVFFAAIMNIGLKMLFRKKDKVNVKSENV